MREARAEGWTATGVAGGRSAEGAVGRELLEGPKAVSVALKWSGIEVQEADAPSAGGSCT